MELIDVSDFSVNELVKKWQVFGYDYNGTLPKHPEFLFRVNNTWRGWNYLVGQTDKNSNVYKENEARDYLEDRAWLIFKSRIEL